MQRLQDAQALRMKRYELNHVEGAKAYGTLAAELWRKTEIEFEIDGQPPITDPALTEQAIKTQGQHYAENEKATDLSRKMLGLYLNAPWRQWLDDHVFEYENLSYIPEMDMSGKPITPTPGAFIVGESRNRNIVADELDEGLARALFEPRLADDFPPTPSPAPGSLAWRRFTKTPTPSRAPRK
jgi:hypothetical protein